MTKPNGFPDVPEASYVLVCVEGRTGIVLNLKGDRAIADDERYRVYPTLEEAVAAAERDVAAHPLWECVVFDHAANRVRTIADEQALVGDEST